MQRPGHEAPAEHGGHRGPFRRIGAADHLVQGRRGQKLRRLDTGPVDMEMPMPAQNCIAIQLNLLDSGPFSARPSRMRP